VDTAFASSCNKASSIFGGHTSFQMLILIDWSFDFSILPFYVTLQLEINRNGCEA
jgi:hypothetical protein